MSNSRDEYTRLFEFVKNKSLRVKNIGNKVSESIIAAGGVGMYEQVLHHYLFIYSLQ